MTLLETPTVVDDRRRWKALAVIALIQFIVVMDITVVNVALPSIQRDLGFSRAGLAWVVDGYVLTAGGLLLLGGRLADLLGRRRMFFLGVGLFAAASIASGAAADPAMLVGSRFAQGAGEAIASPAAFGLIALLFTEPKERAQAIGIFGGIAGLGGTLGPVISGFLIAALSWRWIFYVNVPVAIFSIVAVARLVDESRASSSGARPDVSGAVLGTAGLSALVYGFISAANHPWGSSVVLAPLAAGVAVLGLFVRRERQAGDPLIPAGFLRNRTRVTANFANLIFASVFFTVFFLMTLYFQEVEHYSALATGVAYLPIGLFIGAGIGLASSLVPRVGVRPVLSAGGLLFATGVLLLSRLSVHGSYWSEAFPALVIMALGAGFSFSGFGNASMHEVSGEDASLASGVNSTAQSVGGAIGLAVLATVALRDANRHLAHGVSASAAITSGTISTFRVGALVALAGAVLVTVIRFGAAPQSSQILDRNPSTAELNTSG